MCPLLETICQYHSDREISRSEQSLQGVIVLVAITSEAWYQFSHTLH
jgi:hypothetical protein